MVRRCVADGPVVPPDWQLELHNDKQTGWTDVSQSTYKRTRLGSYVKGAS